jgi:ABC-type nitrate/sulfonate/bicarbonate transport system substrate-binding protein
MRTVTLLPRILVVMLAVSTAAGATPDAIKFGYPQTPAGALAVVADKAELWAKNGLKVDSISFAVAINARDAIISGRIDVGIAGLSNFLVGSSEAGLVALGIAVDQCASAAILVKPGSTIRSLADLRGKRIASMTGTITHSSFVNRLLPSAKLTVSDVQLVNLRFQDMVSALSAGSVDAVTAVDPYLSSAEQSGAGTVVTDFCRGGPVPLIFAASDKFAKDTDLVRKFINTWQDAARLFQSNPDRVAQIYADSLKARGYDLPHDVVRNIVRRLNVRPDTVLFSPQFLSYVREEAKFMQQAGQLSRLPDLAVAFPKQPVN